MHLFALNTSFKKKLLDKRANCNSRLCLFHPHNILMASDIGKSGLNSLLPFKTHQQTTPRHTNFIYKAFQKQPQYDSLGGTGLRTPNQELRQVFNNPEAEVRGSQSQKTGEGLWSANMLL